MQLIDALNLSDRELLARTLMAEAGNGSINDMLPVGNVIMNRARQGGTLQDVILAPAQFSPWNTTKMPDGSMLYAAGKGQGRDMGGIKPSNNAYEVADLLLSGEATDVTEGATHFFNPSISWPNWANGMDGKEIGSHLFGSAGGFRTGAPKIQTQQPLSATSGIGGGSLLSKEPEMSMNPNTPPRSGLLGFMDIMRQQDPETGMTAMERFGAALDPLVRPNERMGEQFRESGARRLKTQSKNKTLEWLKSQEGGETFAQAIEMGVPIGDVYSAYLKSQAGDYVVVGNTLVDRKTGKPIFTAPRTAQSQGVIRLADGTEISLGKQTGDQSGAMVYGSRMDFSNKILSATEDVGTELFQQIAQKIPIFGQALTSTEFKSYDQARTNFVNAVLRRESGAAIAASEFESANKQYFPQPFDPPEIIAQKRATRELATTMMLAASGPNATQYAKDQAAEFAKKLNPLYGTPEYDEQRKELEKNQNNSTTTPAGNERLNF